MGCKWAYLDARIRHVNNAVIVDIPEQLRRAMRQTKQANSIIHVPCSTARSMTRTGTFRGYGACGVEGGGKLKRREEGRGEERERKGGGMEEDVGGRVEGREGLSA